MSKLRNSCNNLFTEAWHKSNVLRDIPRDIRG